MSTVIRDLAARLSLEAENFNNGIKSALREGKEWEKQIKPSMEITKDWGLAMTATGGAILTAMFAATKATADYADNLNDMSQKVGVSTETLSKWGFAAEQSGSTLEGVGTGLKILAKNMELATAGGKAQTAAFAAAGITTKQLAAAGGDVNKILPLLADSFAKSEDGAGKTAIAMQLLGKSGTELIPMLNAGSAGLDEMGLAAERTGRVVSQDAARAADEFNDRLAELEGSMKGMAGVVGTVLIPPLTELITLATDAAVTVRGWAAEHPDLIKGIAAAAAAITGAGGLLLGISGVLFVLPKLTVAFTLLTGPIGLTVAAVTALTAAFVYFHDYIKTGVLTVMSAFMTAIGGMISVAEKAARAIGQHGLADELGIAADAVKFYRDETDKQVVSTMAAIMTIDKTDKALKAEEASRVKAITATGKHTLALATNTAAADTNAKKIADILKDNQAKMFRYADDVQAKMSQAVDAITTKWTKAYETIARITESNRQAMARHAEGVATDASRWIDAQSDAWLKAQNKKITDMDAAGKEIDRVNQEAGDRLQTEWNQQAEAWRNAWSTAMGNVVSGFAQGVSDLIFEGKNFKDSMVGIMKELGKSIVEILVTNAFGNVAKSLSGLLGKVPGLGSVFGGAGAAGIGSILGIGGGAAAPAVAGGFLPVFGGIGAAGAGTALGVGGAGAGAAGAGAAGAGGGLSMASIGAFATNPFTIAIAGALVGAIAWTKSQAHHEADTFVQNFQNQFANAQGTGVLNHVVDAFNAANAAGSLTVEAAEEAQRQVQSLWDAFSESANAFAQGGKDEALVVRQAFETLTPLIQRVMADMREAVSGLSPNGTDSASNSAPKDIVIQIILENLTIAHADMTDLEVRDNLMPKIMTALQTGIRGYREQITQIVISSSAGIVSSEAPA